MVGEVIGEVKYRMLFKGKLLNVNVRDQNRAAVEPAAVTHFLLGNHVYLRLRSYIVLLG